MFNDMIESGTIQKLASHINLFFPRQLRIGSVCGRADFSLIGNLLGKTIRRQTNKEDKGQATNGRSFLDMGVKVRICGVTVHFR